MIPKLAALLLFALLAPYAAAEEAPPEDASAPAADEADKQKPDKDEKAKCKEKNPCNQEEPDEHEFAVSAEIDQSDPTNSYVAGGRRDSDGSEEQAAAMSQSSSSSSTYLEVVLLGNGAPVNVLGGGSPIPSCEPWLVLGKNPQVRPECLMPDFDP